MTEDQDNAGEVVAGAVRVALTAAGQLAEQSARRREADLREAERESAARVATVQSQLAAERELALRSVRDVVQRGNAATVDDVVRAWEQARSWDDPTMGLEQARLEDRIRERFGVDVLKPSAQCSTGEQITVAGVLASDLELQARDERDRNAAGDRVFGIQADLVIAGAGDEAAHARALAAQSHPIPAGLAARKPGGAPAAAPRGRRHRKVVEVQSPGK